MKLKWGKRTYTFMVIPDANSKVVRFRLSALLLYTMTITLSVAAVALVSITLYLNITGIKNLNDKKAIALELAVKSETFARTLSYKNETIENLQNSIVDLSEQTEVMKQKVDELKALEEEIRSISYVDSSRAGSSQSDNRDVQISSYYPDNEDEFIGVGGATIEVSDEDIDLLVLDTQATLENLDIDVDSLKLQLSDTKESLIEYIRLMRITPSIWPTVSTKISSKYGYRKDPFTRRAAFHAGVDISGSTSDPVYATADGVVTSAGYHSSYGNNIMVKHASGVTSHYSHLKKILIKEGQNVKQGEEIGLLGSSGRSTGPHLHYEIIKNGSSIDPMPYLQTAEKDVTLDVQEKN